MLGPPSSARIGLGDTLAFDPQELLDDGIYTLVSNNSHPDVQAKAYDVHEKLGRRTLQADIRSQLGSTELTGNIGVQAVHTDQVSNGLTIVRRSSPGALAPTSDGAKYWDVMPSMNLSFRFPNDWVIRAGLAREVQRPRMDSCVSPMNMVFAVWVRSFPVLTGTARKSRTEAVPRQCGGSQLREVLGHQGLRVAQLFYKYFDTFVVEQNLPNVPFDYTGLPIPSPWQTTDPNGLNYLPPQGITNGFIKRPYNVSGGKMYGAELGGTLRFGDFVSALDGFGLTGGVG